MQDENTRTIAGRTASADALGQLFVEWLRQRKEREAVEQATLTALYQFAGGLAAALAPYALQFPELALRVVFRYAGPPQLEPVASLEVLDDPDLPLRSGNLLLETVDGHVEISFAPSRSARLTLTVSDQAQAALSAIGSLVGIDSKGRWITTKEQMNLDPRDFLVVLFGALMIEDVSVADAVRPLLL